MSYATSPLNRSVVFHSNKALYFQSRMVRSMPRYVRQNRCINSAAPHRNLYMLRSEVGVANANRDIL
jgi:hypothetical protein